MSSTNVMHALRTALDEQQTRTFTRWWNLHLAECDPPLQVNHLFEDVKSGINFIKLLEVLSSSSCGKFNKKPISKFQKLENLNIFLDHLKARSIKTVNIGAEDLVEGDKKLILGITYTLILRYEIHAFGTVEKELLEWARSLYKRMNGGADLKGNWHDAFNDGQAFCSIVHDAVPAAFNHEDTKKMDAETALRTAFDAAETHLGVPKLLEPSDFNPDHHADDKSVILYVARLKQARDVKVEAAMAEEQEKVAKAKEEKARAIAKAEEVAAEAEAFRLQAEAAAKAKAQAEAERAKAQAEAEAARKVLQEKAHSTWTKIKAAAHFLGAANLAHERGEAEEAAAAERAAQLAKEKAARRRRRRRGPPGEAAARQAAEAAAAKRVAEEMAARKALEEQMAKEAAAAEKAKAEKAAAEAEVKRREEEEATARKAQEEARRGAEKAAMEAKLAAEKQEAERIERAAREAEQARLASEALVRRKAEEEELARQKAEAAAQAAEEAAAAAAAAPLRRNARRR